MGDPLEQHHEPAGRRVAGGKIGAAVAVEVAGRRDLVLADEARDHAARGSEPAGRRAGPHRDGAVGLPDQQIVAAVARDVTGDEGAGGTRAAGAGRPCCC